MGLRYTLYVKPIRAVQPQRGLADKQLQIEDYEPQHSIVITPNKMIKYYDDVKLTDEFYPWPGMFHQGRYGVTVANTFTSCL